MTTLQELVLVALWNRKEIRWEEEQGVRGTGEGTESVDTASSHWSIGMEGVLSGCTKLCVGVAVGAVLNNARHRTILQSQWTGYA